MAGEGKDAGVEAGAGDGVTVKVCDAIMGSGKTESAIALMNEDAGSRYVFITPYLDEVERIKRRCKERDFQEPKNRGEGKLDDLHALLASRSNIASTHALFRSYTDETITLIRNGGYKLILDEVFESVQIVDVSGKDLGLLREKMLKEDDGHRVRWVGGAYEGRFEDLRDMCVTGNVFLYNDRLLLWKFPIDVFRAFNEAIILTYKFDAQVQKYYFDVNRIGFTYIGAGRVNGEYRFCPASGVPDYVRRLPSLIHIVEDEKLNAIGDDRTSLSASWYAKARGSRGQPLLREMKKNLANLFKNRFASPSEENMWTVFKDYREDLKGKGYTKGFLSCNSRATNAYRNRRYLAYCVNVFYNPLLKGYFEEKGVEVREDEYALSEMLQWVWRSAIRDGREIWLYIPSRRMRTLFQKWLYEASESGGGEPRKGADNGR